MQIISRQLDTKQYNNALKNYQFKQKNYKHLFICQGQVADWQVVNGYKYKKQQKEHQQNKIFELIYTILLEKKIDNLQSKTFSLYYTLLNILGILQKNINILNIKMGCGSSNQVHQSNNPPPEQNNNLVDRQQDDRSICNGRCYLFGQSSGQKKVVLFNSKKQIFTTISSRLRIPTPKVKLQPIQILYEQSQEVILPELMKKGPHPPFNNMFGTFCRRDVIFLCGGVNYQGQQVYSQSYFYNINPQTTKPKGSISPNNPINNSKIFIKFERTASMSQKRYSHMGIYICQRQFKSQYIYIFGGKNFRNQSINNCQKFDLISKKWKDIAPMFTPRSQGCAIRFMGNVYVFGGISNFRVYPQNIEVYNPKQDSWSMLNIQLHRGIRSCLVTSHKSNEIIIIGGISNIDKQQENISSIIKVNLVQETYVWQGNFPQKISNIKYTYDTQGQKLTIFSNSNNIIYSYDTQNKKWRNYGLGYKNYIPIVDLYRFTCVAEPLDLKFDRQQIKNNEIKQKQMGNSAKNLNTSQQYNITNIFTLGNQNYPCVINYKQKKNIFKQQLMKVSMKLQLRSNMNICLTSQGYFITGGCDKNQRFSYNQSFLYNPKIIPHKAVQQLQTIGEGRHSAAIISVGEAVYIFGGIKNNGYALKSCQKFNLKQKRWQNICNPMLKAVYNHIAYQLQFDQTKILLLGGRQFNGNPNTLLQIYDTSIKNTKIDVISYEQFSIFKEGDIKQIFIRKLTEKQLEEVQINQQQYLLQTGHLYSHRQDIDKQPKMEQLKTGRSNHSMSPLGKIIPSPKYKKLQILHKSPQTKSTFKNLIIQNIPESYRKNNLKINQIPTPNPKYRVKTAQQQYLQKEQQEIRFQNHKIIKLKTQILSIKPKTSQQDSKKPIEEQKKQSKPPSPPPSKKIQEENYHINLNLMERQNTQKDDDLKQEELIQIDLDQDQFIKNDHIKQESGLKKQQGSIQIKEQSEQLLSIVENNQDQGVEFMTMGNIKEKVDEKQQDSSIALKKPVQIDKIKIKEKNKEKNTQIQKLLTQYQILRIFLYKQDKTEQKQEEIEKKKEQNITQNKSKQKQLKLNLKIQLKDDQQNNRQISKSSRIADQKIDNHIDNVSKTSRLGNSNLDNSNYFSVKSRISQSNISHSQIKQENFNKITKVQAYNLLINKKTYQMHMIKNKKNQLNKKRNQNEHVTLLPDNISYTHAFKSKHNNNHFFLNLLPNQSNPNNPRTDKLMNLYIVDSEMIGSEISNQKQDWIKIVDIQMDDRLNHSGMGQYRVFTVPKQF